MPKGYCWIVTSVTAEGCELLGVYTTKEKAIKEAKNNAFDYYCHWNDYNPKDLEIRDYEHTVEIFKIGGEVSWEASEWEIE